MLNMKICKNYEKKDTYKTSRYPNLSALKSVLEKKFQKK